MSIIARSQFDRNQEPHDLTRRLVMDFDTMTYSERRTVLQALPLPDLVSLCHLLAQHRPRAYVSPDLTWVYLRLVMEPLSWDIKTDMWADGPHYVAFYAGQAFLSRSALDPNNLIALDQDMDEWFNRLYPRRLIDVGTEVIYAA